MMSIHAVWTDLADRKMMLLYASQVLLAIRSGMRPGKIGSFLTDSSVPLSITYVLHLTAGDIDRGQGMRKEDDDRAASGHCSRAINTYLCRNGSRLPESLCLAWPSTQAWRCKRWPSHSLPYLCIPAITGPVTWVGVAAGRLGRHAPPTWSPATRLQSSLQSTSTPPSCVTASRSTRRRRPRSHLTEHHQDVVQEAQREFRRRLGRERHRRQEEQECRVGQRARRPGRRRKPLLGGLFFPLDMPLRFLLTLTDAL